MWPPACAGPCLQHNARNHVVSPTFLRGDHAVLGFRNVMSEFLCACLNWPYRRRLKSAGCGDGLSGDPAGLRASQERYNVSNVFWLSHSAHGGVLGNLR